MTPEQIELTKTAARSVIAEQQAGRSVDPLRLMWAEQFLRANQAVPREANDGEAHETHR